MTSVAGISARVTLWMLISGIGLTRIPALNTLHLPDASIAAFFLGGFYLGSFRSFGVLLMTAFAADLAAFQFGFAPTACLTPAYLFLLPTYGLVWTTGRSARPAALVGNRSARFMLTRVALAILGAFALSNAAYYAFAMDAAAISWLQYAVAVSGYLPDYAGQTLIYVLPILVAERWLARLKRPLPAAA